MTHTLPTLLWHGTSLDTARLITRCGLIHTRDGAYLSSARDIALHFARVQGKAYGIPHVFKPALIAVPSTGVDTNALVPDTTMMLAPVRRPRFYPESPAMDQLGGTINKILSNEIDGWVKRATLEHWSDSLTKVGSVLSKSPVVLSYTMLDISIEGVLPFASEREMEASEYGRSPDPHALTQPPQLESFGLTGQPALGLVLKADERKSEDIFLAWARATGAAQAGIGEDRILSEKADAYGFVLRIPTQPYNARDLMTTLSQAFDGWHVPFFLTGNKTAQGHTSARVLRLQNITYEAGEKTRFGTKTSSCVVSFDIQKVLCSADRVAELHLFMEDCVTL